jgi:hypothetical protein
MRIIMTQQRSPNYRSVPPHHNGHTEGIMDQVGDAAAMASDQARELAHKAGTLASELGTAVKERPYTTLAIAAGLAFAVGALWKLSHSRQPSTLEAWMARMPEMPKRDALIPRRWRWR